MKVGFWLCCLGPCPNVFLWSQISYCRKYEDAFFRTEAGHFKHFSSIVSLFSYLLILTFPNLCAMKVRGLLIYRLFKKSDFLMSE